MTVSEQSPTPVAPPSCRITVNLNGQRAWLPAQLSLVEDHLHIALDRGGVISVSVADVRRVGIFSVFISVYTNHEVPGTQTKIINLAFGDGNEWFSGFSGNLDAMMRQRKLEKGTVDSPDVLAWRAYFESTGHVRMEISSARALQAKTLKICAAIVLVICLLYLIPHL
jgi:hypothetical protein